MFLFFLKRGSLATTDVQKVLTRKMMDLRAELRDLEQKETFLDLQKFWIEQSIRNTTEDCSKYPFSIDAKRAEIDVEVFRPFHLFHSLYCSFTINYKEYETSCHQTKLHMVKQGGGSIQLEGSFPAAEDLHRVLHGNML